MRIMRVKFQDQVPDATTLEVFYAQDKRGSFRRIAAPHEHDVPLCADELRAWFKRLGITHVEHCYGNTEGDGRTQLKDGLYPVGRWLAWAQHMEDDA